MNEVKKLNKDEAIKIMELPISYEERGIEKGKEIGKEIGKEKALQEVVKNMLELGVDLETISKYTKLNKDKIECIKKSTGF